DIHFEIVKGASVTVNPVDTFVQGSEYVDLTFTLHHTGVVESIIDPLPTIWKDEQQLFDWEFLFAPEGPIFLEIGEIKEIGMRAVAPPRSFGYFTIKLDGISNTADIIPGASTAFISPRSNITMDKLIGGPFDAGQVIELKTTVRNNGDISKQALLGVAGVPSDYMVEILPSRDLFLEPGNDVLITISLYPKDEGNSEPFKVTLTVTASPDEAGAPWQTVASSEMNIDFRELPNLEVRVLTIPSGYIKEGTVIWVNVTVANIGNVEVDSVDVIITEISFYLSNLEVGRKTISLAPGDIRTVSFHWTTRISARSLRASIRGPEGMEEMDTTDNDLIESVYVKGDGPREVVQGEDGGGLLNQETAAVGGLGIGLLAAIMVFFGTRDAIKYPVLVGLIPLYSKLRPEHILNNRLRKRIYVYVQNHPGEHFRSILTHLNLTNGTLAHHLYTLEKENLIRSQRDGLYRRFYPAGYQIDPNQVSLTSIQKRIMEKVNEEPGLSQKDISEKLELSNSTVNYNIKSLKEKELIEVRKEGKSTQIYPMETQKS
ncbi:MAG: winged helix-turn-helix transcriptional regulator, partial [Thermoplasmatota archaeon]